ncbi:hypothetical protein AAFC00_000810 [Neodothiora populina]|uniref:Potassium transport protein n=1 Tax=Neodothiora populina TaxID=2781224 RepID=A0ABR3PM36_9PEZI
MKQTSPIKQLLSLVSKVKLNFYRLHLIYFIFVILLSSVILYGSTTNGNSGNAEEEFRLRYIDALFLCASAMTSAGLNVINLGSLTGFQQAVLFTLIPLGNVIIVSTSMVYIRRYWFRKKMDQFLEHSRTGRVIAKDVERQEANLGSHRAPNYRAAQAAAASETDFRPERPSRAPTGAETLRKRRTGDFHAPAHGGFPLPWQTQRFRNAVQHPFRSLSMKPETATHPYLSFKPVLDKKGRIYSLDERQKTELGGVEYRALKLLSWLLPAYILFWVIIGIVILVPYGTVDRNVENIIQTSQPGNLSPGWWATFTVISAFGNCGMSPLDANLVPFQGYYLILIVTGALILLGNQFFPIFLRLFIWTIFKMVPRDSQLHHTCAFLLQHPRRCFILLFPSINTWYLLAVQFTLGNVLWAFFGILNIGLPEFEAMSAGRETALGLFQALGARVGGMYVVLLSNVAPALQIMYLIAMYISAFPIIVSLRQTNVYEERSLGLEHQSADDPSNENKGSSISMHVRRQLAYDLWWLALAIWLISIIERIEIQNDDMKFFNIWTIMFEVFSGYGNVGLSLGVPFDDYSFSGVWHTLSKLVLIVVMLRGRHRGLPYAVDRAVLLPGEELMEEMDREINFQGQGEWGDGDTWGRREMRDPEGRDLCEEDKAKLRKEFLGTDDQDGGSSGFQSSEGRNPSGDPVGVEHI